MSEKLSTRNSCPAVSPLRSSTFISRSVNPNKITSKRNGVKKPGDKTIDEKKNEGKSSREEFGTNALNFTLVGSPAPRSQVRALVSSTNMIAPKPKVKASYGSKPREQNPHEICMEKLYQFADNPTKFVRLESRDDRQMQLDLEFSDRSEESENFYNSHNIAFGENGEYRIPEYDHIRFLQFSIGNNQDSETAQVQDNSSSMKSDRAVLTDTKTTATEELIKEDHIPTIPDGSETPRSLHGEGGILDLSEMPPRIDEIVPWNSMPSHSLSWSKNAGGSLENAQSYPLGSAINYKTNINPEVERFMLNTGPESSDENFTKSTQHDRLVDESILSRNFAPSMRLQPFEKSVENSSRTSPVTSRTTLSQASSGDGTWHGHSLNSPYFASVESNSWTDSKKNVNKGSSKVFADYEETDEYLTIVKNEQDSTTSDKAGVQRYIFITNQFLGSEMNSQSSTDSENNSRYDNEDVNDSLTRSAVMDADSSDSSTNIDRVQSTEVGRSEVDHARSISSGESLSDYCIGNIFTRFSSSSAHFSSPSSSSPEDLQPSRTREFSTPSASLEDKTGIKDDRTDIESSPEIKSLNLSNESPSSEGVYMTLEEVSLAADYTSKLSEIFNRVLKRSELENRAKSSNEVAVDGLSSTTACLTSQNTSKLIHTCLESPNFCTSHISS